MTSEPQAENRGAGGRDAAASAWDEFDKAVAWQTVSDRQAAYGAFLPGFTKGYAAAEADLAALRAERDEARDLLASARSYIPRGSSIDEADLLADIAKALGERP